MFDIIAFDADDTLWHNERLYTQAQNEVSQLLAGYGISDDVQGRLYGREVENIPIYGYGIKSFALSMIEFSIELTAGRIRSDDIATIIQIAKGMLTAEVVLFDGVENTVRELSRDFDLMVITKGDLIDQESKLRRSGIDGHFRCVEIVSEKSNEVYETLLKKYNITPDRFLMVGNSLKSDILPIVQIGGHAVYVPYELTWMHENLTAEQIDPSFYHEIENLKQLPPLVKRLSDQ
jgi:putative hydrolase of the HAD superfamily